MTGASIHDLKIDRSADQPKSSGLWWLGLLGIAILVAFLCFLYLRPSQLTVVKTIRAETMSEGSGSGTVLNGTGYVTARRSATVSSKVTGKITEILVEEGDVVSEGQVVARLDPVNVKAIFALSEAQLEASKASTDESSVLLEEAKLNLKRVTRLASEQIASQSDLDEAKARVDSLEARLHRLRAEIGVAERQVAMRQQEVNDLIIQAPFSGVVISKDAQPGEVISPVSAGSGFTRTGICTLVDMGSLEIEVDVNESFINRVSPNQPVTAVLDAYSDWKIQAKVIAIVPSADRQKATVKVRIGFTQLDARILPEMGVKVSFQDPSTPGREESFQRRVQIPDGSLVDEGARSYVWIVDGGKVEKRSIKVLSKNEGFVIIEAGVRVGEILVVDPPLTLKNGSAVEVDSL